MLLVLRVNDVGDMRQVGPSVTLSGNVQIVGSVLLISRSKQLQERVYVLGRSGRVVNASRVGVRVTDSDGLVEEEDVGVRGPRVGVVGRVDVGTLRGRCGDHARTEFEEKSGGR